ncbi:MAG: tRNA (guanosine(46)-N7)-methyltransferase TrmB [Succinivibrionaceae bacterium]|nr:tRNA (guanosine(46)-N7)-methyltransferase TrmB [Succinivibrionaceae bacterium]
MGAPEEGGQHHRVRSFVVRQGRLTDGQARALRELGPRYILPIEASRRLDLAAAFGREAPLTLEIGFGMGASFLAMAAAHPGDNYLGIEVHPPGVGAALKEIEAQGLTNVRIIKDDAFVVLSSCLAPGCIDALQVFFPDPWPKKRHHKRRLINDEFMAMVAPLIRAGGEVRLATDWEEYAVEMLAVMGRLGGFENLAPGGGFMPRPDWRPLTKFEQRGLALGHGVWDVVFRKC